MNPPDSREWHRLFNAALNDQLCEADREQLASALKSSAEARQLWFLYTDNECSLAEMKTIVEMKRRKTGLSWLSWRSLAAAAAGLVIGAFSATAVWAFATVNSPRVQEREMPLVDGSFERTAQVIQSRPLLKNVWHGDPAEIVGTVGRVSPHGGAHMLRFLASAIAEDEREKRDAADMWQILDVPEGGPHRVRVRAWFASDAGADTSFVVMATALSCDLQEVASAWGARFDGDPRVLSAGCKTTVVRSADASWHLCEMMFDVPQGARLLVLDVAGRKVPGVPAAKAFPAQFVDDVSVTIADEPALP